MSLSTQHFHRVVVAALVERDGKLLVHQRPPGGWGAGKWEFPGGKVERDEDPRVALVRECSEELGVEVRVHGIYEVLSHHYPDLGSVILLFFHTEIVAGEPVEQEGGHLEWADPAVVLEYDWLEADLPLIQRWWREKTGGREED